VKAVAFVPVEPIEAQSEPQQGDAKQGNWLPANNDLQGTFISFSLFKRREIALA
jgi:hypothetical protein